MVLAVFEDQCSHDDVAVASDVLAETVMDGISTNQ
jgi:hypothetical protein